MLFECWGAIHVCNWNSFIQWNPIWKKQRFIFFFDERIFMCWVLLLFTESGIQRRNNTIFSNRKHFLTAVYSPQYVYRIRYTETKQRKIFFKSKAFIDRNLISCYQLNPSITDVFAEPFKMKPNIGKSSTGYFFVFQEWTLKFQEARVSIKFILKALYHKQSTIFPISKKLRGW